MKWVPLGAAKWELVVQTHGIVRPVRLNMHELTEREVIGNVARDDSSFFDKLACALRERGSAVRFVRRCW
jgi:hypothetical protein